MKFTSTMNGFAKPQPLTEEQKAEKVVAIRAAEAKRQAELEAQEAETAKANGATVSLSGKSLNSLVALLRDDQRVRSNIQWGIVRGLLLYSLFMIPVVFVIALIVSAR